MSNSPKLILCPYCGHTQTAPERCEQCGGLFEPLSRKATQIKMGPWYIRDKSNPFRPGCSYEVLKKQIKLGKIKPTSIIRGPSTYQFWSIARNVPGVAHLLGYCHRCGSHTKPDRIACPDCSEPFMPVEERNELGLMYRSDAAIELAKRNLDQDLASRTGVGMKALTPDAPPETGPPPPTPADPSDESIGISFDINHDARDDADMDLSQPGHTAFGLKLEEEQPADPAPTIRVTRSHPPAPAPPQRPKPSASIDLDSSSVDLGTSYSRASQEGALQALRERSNRLSTMVLLLLIINLLTLAIWFPRMLGDSWESLDLWALVERSNRKTTRSVATHRAEIQPTDLARPVEQPGTDPDSPIATPHSIKLQPSNLIDDLTPQATPDHGQNQGQVQAQPRDPTGIHLAGELAEADRLMKDGKPKEALAVLERIAKTVPPEQRPIGLDRAIQRLEEQIAHVEAASFFGIPVK